jgi:hypothetical protein
MIEESTLNRIMYITKQIPNIKKSLKVLNEPNNHLVLEYYTKNPEIIDLYPTRFKLDLDVVTEVMFKDYLKKSLETTLQQLTEELDSYEILKK